MHPSPAHDISGHGPLLKRLKLACFALVLVFLFHALPGAHMPEAWPLTRWAMFSSSPPRLAIEYVTEYRLEMLTAEGETRSLPANSLYRGMGVAAPGPLAQRVTLGAVNSEYPDQQSYQQSIISRLTAYYQVPIVEVQVYQCRYAYDAASLPPVDYSQPPDCVLMGSFSAPEY